MVSSNTASHSEFRSGHDSRFWTTTIALMLMTYTCHITTCNAFPFAPKLDCIIHHQKLNTYKSSALFAGFGSANSNKNSKKNTGKKVRKVVGSTGSGTKPLRVAANTFDAIYKDFGKDCANDLYVRSIDNDESTFWFVGKAARRLENVKGQTVPTAHEAVLSQKRLILEYAKTLRPQNLSGPFGKNLEIWIAPGNSEMDTVQNKVTLEKVNGTVDDIRNGFSVEDVGYNPEIYVGDEVKDGGLRVKRDNEGRPLKAEFEINA